MELHDVSYGIEYVARPFLLFFSSENRLLYFRYRESDLAHLKLVFEFSIYNVWKSVEYGVSNELDTSRNWGFLEVRDTFDISRIFIFIQFLKRRIWSFWIRRMVLVVVVLCELIHYCLQNLPYTYQWAEKTVPVAKGSSETTTERYMENYKNVSQDIRDQLNAEAEAIQIILTGIDNDIYSIVDAYLETNLYWEFGKFTSRDGESLESYYSRFYKMMNELVRNQCNVTNHQVNVQFLLQLQPEWQRFVTLVKQSQELKTVSYHKLYDILKQHQNEVNEIRTERLARTANPLALVAQQQPVYHPPNHPTQNTQYSSTRSQQSTRNRGKAIVTSSAPTYDPEPATVTEDDEMSKEKEIDKLMALISLSFKKIYKPTNNNLRTSSNTSRANQENSLRINRGTGYDHQRAVNVAGARENVGTPVVQKSGIQCYNCKEYGHVSRECQKPKRVKDAAYHKEKMLLCKQEEVGVQLNAEQADWKDDTDDESEDQELEAHYILKKFQAELDKYNDVNYASKVEIDCAKAKGDLMSYKIEFEKSSNAYTRKINDLNQMISDMKKELCAHQETISIMSQAKEAQIKLYKTREDKELDKVIALENKVKVLNDIVYKTGQSVQTMNMLNHNCKTSFAKPEFLKKAQRANPRLYDIGCYNDNLALMLAPDSDEMIRLEKERRSKLSDLIRPFDYDQLNNLYDLFVPQREKSAEQHYFPKTSKMSHTSSNKEFSKESFRKQTTLLEKQMDESIPWDQKCKSSKELFKIKKSVDMIFDGVERCKQTIAKRTYFGNIDPFIQNTIEGNFGPQISRLNADLENFHLCLNEEMVADLRYFNSLEHEVDTLKSQLETQKTQFLNEIDRLSREYYYADHMNAILGVYTDLDEVTNLQCDYLETWEKCEHLEKELSKVDMSKRTVKFGNDQIAPILGYGDLVQGTITIKRVYYVEGLNHNLFSVGQFCDADLEVAFWKSTYSTTPNPICLMAKATSSQAWLWHRTEFLNKTLHAYFAKEGIRHETSTARTPEQNGVVERRNRTLVEAARTMLSAAKVPLFFWAEAIATTCFTQNRSLVIPRHEKTPYHIINARKPSVKFFHIFGSLCYIVRDGENLDKMKEKVTTSNELELLYSLMFSEILNGTSPVVSKSSDVHAADNLDKRQQQNTTHTSTTNDVVDPPPLNIQSTHQTPTQVPTITAPENIIQAENNTENA
ncbi:retrovirus-related pol polyprotein from transposon TNT 1-94 [Tanacetum coccineum]